MKPQQSSAARAVTTRAVTRSAIDVVLVGLGLASAAASVVFAAAMLERSDHTPLVNGMQYLAVFGQPRLHAVPSSAPPAGRPVAVARASVGAAPGAPGKSIDFGPTGSIVRLSPEEPVDTDPYRLVAVEPGMAWLRNSEEMRVVKPGDYAPGLGRIAAIVKRDGRWTLIDDSGATLLSADAPQSAATAADPFSQRMIFGGSN